MSFDRILVASKNGPLLHIVFHLPVLDLLKHMSVSKGFYEVINYVIQKKMILLQKDEYNQFFGFDACVGEKLMMKLIPLIDFNFSYDCRGRFGEYTVLDIILQKGMKEAFSACVNRGVKPAPKQIQTLLRDLPQKDQGVKDILDQIIVKMGNLDITHKLLDYVLKKQDFAMLEHLLCPKPPLGRNRPIVRPETMRDSYSKVMLVSNPPLPTLTLLTQHYSPIAWTPNFIAAFSRFFRKKEHHWTPSILLSLFQLKHGHSHAITGRGRTTIETMFMMIKDKNAEFFHQFVEAYVEVLENTCFSKKVAVSVLTHYAIGTHRSVHKFRQVLQKMDPISDYHYKQIFPYDSVDEEIFSIAINSGKLGVSFQSLLKVLERKEWKKSIEMFDKRNVAPGRETFQSRDMETVLEKYLGILDTDLYCKSKNKHEMKNRDLYEFCVRLGKEARIFGSVQNVHQWMKKGRFGFMYFMLVTVEKKMTYPRNWMKSIAAAQRLLLAECFEYLYGKHFWPELYEKVMEEVVWEAENRLTAKGVRHQYLRKALGFLSKCESEEEREWKSDFIQKNFLKNGIGAIKNPFDCYVYRPKKAWGERDKLKGLLKHAISGKSKLLTTYFMDKCPEWIVEEDETWKHIKEDYFVTDMMLEKAEKWFLLNTYPGRFDKFCVECSTCKKMIRHFDPSQFEEDRRFLIPPSEKELNAAKEKYRLARKKDERRKILSGMLDKWGIFSCQSCSYVRDIPLGQKKRRKGGSRIERIEAKKRYDKLHCRECVEYKKISFDSLGDTKYVLYCKKCYDNAPTSIRPDRGEVAMREENFLYGTEPYRFVLQWYGW